jgi:PAS domain S-box-containing protein
MLLLNWQVRGVAHGYDWEKWGCLRVGAAKADCNLMNKNNVKELKYLIDNLPGMVFCCSYDKAFTFEYVSEGVKELLGYKPSELVHINAFRKLVHPDDQIRNKEILKKIHPGNPRYEMIYRMRTVQGKNKWVKEQGLAIYSEKGNLKQIHGILTDVTSQKIAEMELMTENRLLRETRNDRYRLAKLIGKSPAMQQVYDTILKAAANPDANVLIAGESGTGKELAARAIHDLSKRSPNTFVAVNCGAIPENLIESEFFGYLKGAFTGAFKDKKGYLEAADGGTLLLDEVGEIPPSMQIKLLRALEEKSYIPVGGNVSKNSDFRIIAATNMDLSKLISEGEMRLDFFFRINVIPIKMPALRDRREDIPLLIEHFIERFVTGTEKVIVPFKLLSRLQKHHWPGNVRELKNVVERYITMGEVCSLEAFVPADDADNATPPVDSVQGIPPTSLGEAVESCERNMILMTLQACRWKKGLCAQRLNISWRSLQRKLKKYAIE